MAGPVLSVGNAVWLHSSRSRPGSAFGISKGVKHIAVETAQNVAHKIDRLVVNKISSVNTRAGDVRTEETRAIDVPDIICWRRHVCQRRVIRETAATKPPHAEKFSA